MAGMKSEHFPIELVCSLHWSEKKRPVKKVCIQYVWGASFDFVSVNLIGYVL